MVHIHVIIPVYNAKKYLREAVDSVLKQPYRNIDIVLVNDGSTDGSAELCDEIAANEDRVSVIHQANQGVSAARNAGIDYALSTHKNEEEHRYIAFLDADDRWTADFFDDATLSLFRKSYSLIGFQSCVSNSSLTRRVQTVSMKQGLHRGGTASVWLYDSQHFCAMFYSVKLLQEYEIRFVTGLKYSEDKIFIMQCLYLAENIWLENKLLHYYRMVQNSAIHRRKLGIPYYVPIIDAYLASDQMMSRWKNPERGELREGMTLAYGYIIEMLEEHYRQFGTKKAVDEIMEQKPEYSAILESSTVWKAQHTVEKLNEMTAHPIRFRSRCYTQGFVSKIKRGMYAILYRNRYIAAVIDKKRYPVMIEK